MYIYVIAVSIFALIQQIKTKKNVTFVPKFTFLCEQLWAEFSKNNCKEVTCFQKLQSRNLQLY